MRRALATDMSNGSPVSLISGIVHLRSNAFDSTILKICAGQPRRRGRERTFCTLIESEVEQKMSGAFITLAKRFACGRQGDRGERPTDLSRDLFLLIAREGRELVVLGSDQERHCGLERVSDGQRGTRKRVARRRRHRLLKRRRVNAPC